MATKWKKWKNSIGFLAFVLSISLLITGGLDFWYCCRTLGAGSVSEAFELAVNGEFQESRMFREFISGKLWECLAMGTEEEFYNYGYWYDYGYCWYSDDYAYDEAEVEVIEQEEENTANESVYASDAEEEDRKKNSGEKSSAELYHEYIKDDKNLLYSISSSSNGRASVRYSNMESVTWKENKLQLPEGYNFYLHFDGETVEIQKDGVELDVYGDGIYRKQEDWYVPGFKNLIGKPDWKNLDIVIMTVKEPAIYYGSSNVYSSGGELYNAYQQFMERHRKLQYPLGLIAAGLLLFVLYLLRRKDKQIVMNRIAARTGKVWFECKLLLCFLLPVWMCIGGWIGENVYEAVQTVSLDMGVEDAYLFSGWSTGDAAIAQEYAGTTFSGNILDGFYYLFGYQFVCIMQGLLIFWLFYLFFWDLYKNPRGYRNSLIAKFISVQRSKDLHQRLAVRAVKRFRPVLGLSLAALVCMIVFICFWLGGIRVTFLVFIGFGILAALLAAEYIFQKRNRQFAEDLEKLADKITNIREGNYTETADFTAEDSDLRHMALELEDIRQGMEHAVEDRISSERMKVELVANVSHDIKTPLTSIISYIQLLRQEENLPDYVMDYIRILDEKSQRLKTMVQDVFSISKAASGQLAVELKELDFGKLLYQTLADMEEEISGSPVTVKAEIPNEPVLVVADGGKMYRVFQNLIGNAVKYSLEGSRVYVTLKKDGVFVAASVKNTSSQELNAEIDFAERFTRGDQSRTDGGSGLGLSIAKSFTEACGGTFQLEVIADLFVVTVSFPVSGGEE